MTGIRARILFLASAFLVSVVVDVEADCTPTGNVFPFLVEFPPTEIGSTTSLDCAGNCFTLFPPDETCEIGGTFTDLVPPDSPFQITNVELAQYPNCSGAPVTVPVTLAPGDWLTFDLEFSPPEPGFFEEEWCLFGDNGSTAHWLLSGGDNLVALGDSYSSGEGAGSYTDDTQTETNRCHRSEIAWNSDAPGGDASLALPGFGAFARRSVACSGAVRSDLTSDNHSGNEGEGPQLDRLGFPEMISATIGGNDALFPTIVKMCLTLPLCPLWEAWGPENGSLGDVVDAKIASLRGGALNLTSAYGLVKTRAPTASVFVAGYPSAIPQFELSINPLCPGDLLSSSEREWIRRIATDLNEAIECSAREAGVHFVPIQRHFEGHSACAPGLDWINAITLFGPEESFHPNKRGQKEYARAVAAHIARQGDGSSLPENPDPIPGACSAPVATGTAPLPSLDDLQIVGGFAPECGETEGGYTPGQEVTLLGAGFASGVALELEIHYENGSFDSLGGATADSNGVLDHAATIPGGAPTTGMAMVAARGEGADTAPRLLITTIRMAPSLSDDTDKDTVPDNCDNCPEEPNTPQTDTDSDGLGDDCDACPLDSENDLDGDGVCDDADECVGTDQLDLADEVVSASRTESACSTVTASRYEITSSGHVTFIAGQAIEIGDGFVVQEGGWFTATIGSP